MWCRREFLVVPGRFQAAVDQQLLLVAFRQHVRAWVTSAVSLGVGYFEIFLLGCCKAVDEALVHPRCTFNTATHVRDGSHAVGLVAQHRGSISHVQHSFNGPAQGRLASTSELLDRRACMLGVPACL